MSKASKWPAAIEPRKVSALIPYENNARQHPEDQVARLVASIKEFGFTIPLLVDEANGVIAGHGRLLAAKAAGMAEVPVMVAKGWSDTRKRAYIIADNKLAESAVWDFDILQDELAVLASDDDIDLMSLGFDLGDLADMSEGAFAPELAPEKAVTSVTTGDVERAEEKLAAAPRERALQTLVPVLCPHCAKEFEIDPSRFA